MNLHTSVDCAQDFFRKLNYFTIVLSVRNRSSSNRARFCGSAITTNKHFLMRRFIAKARGTNSMPRGETEVRAANFAKDARRVYLPPFNRLPPATEKTNVRVFFCKFRRRRTGAHGLRACHHEERLHQSTAENQKTCSDVETIRTDRRRHNSLDQCVCDESRFDRFIRQNSV